MMYIRILFGVLICCNCIALQAKEHSHKKEHVSKKDRSGKKQYTFSNCSIKVPVAFKQLSKNQQNNVQNVVKRQLAAPYKPKVISWVSKDLDNHLVICTLSKIPHPNVDVDQVADRVFGNIKTSANTTLMNQGTECVHGPKARWFSIKQKVDGSEYSFLHYILIREGYLYHVNCQADTKNFSNFESTFHSICKSLKTK